MNALLLRGSLWSLLIALSLCVFVTKAAEPEDIIKYRKAVMKSCS